MCESVGAHVDCIGEPRGGLSGVLDIILLYRGIWGWNQKYEAYTASAFTS